MQLLIFGLFFSMYMNTVFGNLLIILVVHSDSHLHIPMYFFLANLSFAEICFTSTTVPKILWNIHTQSKVIIYEGCFSQIFFSIVFGCQENLFLMVMAYDWFVAICQALHYMVIMNPQICRLLVLVSWVIHVLNSSLKSSMLFQLSFVQRWKYPHFFCELNQKIQLACSDTFLNHMVMYFVIVLLVGVPLGGILFSYSKIVSFICKISSDQSKYKAFSSCVYHLSVVSLFYCISLGVYLSSAATQNSHSSAVAHCGTQCSLSC
ncbi:olfactory receptor 7A5-like [Mustela nigripes]|uniref:olfactory receptor 7A5-like n=1 Tax=Mustela nigripes TaxID=77151 RepID=UPI00281687E7|nr:olfactory receptor 7A5-like [Mustela nigripes]